MDKKTIKITTGAMIIAIFAVMLLLNRQTASMFEEMFMFLFPIPMVAYSAKYGWKSSIPVFAAMALMSFLFGTFTTVFYAVTEALIGLVFGSCMHNKVDMTKTLFIVMALSAIVNVLNTIVLASLFGYNLNTEIAEMQSMMNGIFEKAGVAVPETLLTSNYLLQMMIISMVFLGIIQGFIVYELSLLILRRLRFPVQKPKSVFLYYPPKWTGLIALLLFFACNTMLISPADNETLQNLMQSAGICAYIYLICFGFIAIMLFLKLRLTRKGPLNVLICILLFLFFPMLVMVSGAIYIMSSFHRTMEKEYFAAKIQAK